MFQVKKKGCSNCSGRMAIQAFSSLRCSAKNPGVCAASFTTVAKGAGDPGGVAGLAAVAVAGAGAAAFAGGGASGAGSMAQEASPDAARASNPRFARAALIRPTAAGAP